jgi:UDP-3-O-[3-hydroxymyristoyl] glucosamine N-acyltransferase
LSHDASKGAVLSGSPAFDNAVWLRSVIALQKLPDLIQKVRALERELARLKADKEQK